MKAGSSSIEPKLRSDLQWIHYADQGRWVIRDPLTANFFSFSDLERTALELMNGRLSLADIHARVSNRFPSARLSFEWLRALVARLATHHLLVPNSTAEAVRATHRQGKRLGANVLAQMLSPLAIRIPLIDPTWLLQHARLPAAVLFHPLVVRGWLLIGCGLLLLVLRQLLSTATALTVDLSSVQGDRWLILCVCYLVAKSLHELGHALACVRFRTECNEVGVMLLCLAPCLYCDTTDTWKLPSKWHRAAIAAAGMYVELILASVAAAVWLVTVEGTLHIVAASMMVVCSVGTLLVNSNPLLKYDGYYILSDLWGVPNLTEQSREAVRGLVRYAFSGKPPITARLDANIWLLGLYAVLSSLYRTFVVGLILWIAWSSLLPLGLGFVAIALTVALLTGILLSQIRMFRNLFRDLFIEGSASLVRVAAFLTLVILAIAFVVEYPLPDHIRARAVTDYADKVPLFASQQGELIYAASLERRLTKGEQLLEFAAPESELELLALDGEIEVLQQELQQMQLRRAYDSSTSYQIPAREEQLSELQSRRQLLLRELAGLRPTAPFDGYLLPSGEVARPTVTAPRDERFVDHLLDASQNGRVVERSTLVGWFSSKEKLRLTALFGEREMKRLQGEMPVLIQWDHNPRHISLGRIIRIAPEPVSYTPTPLIGDAALNSIRNAQGAFQPELPHYEVTIQVETQARPPLGAPATVQIRMSDQTLWQRAVELWKTNAKW